MNLRSMGIIQKWKAIYWPQRNSCEKNQGATAVKLQDISSILTGLVFAIFGALFVLSLEVIWYKFLPKPNVIVQQIRHCLDPVHKTAI